MTATTQPTVRFSPQASPVPCAECGYNRARVAHLYTTDDRNIGAMVLCPDCTPVVERPEGLYRR